MASPERYHAVWLYDSYAGTLHQRADYSWFILSPSYLGDPDRPVLGLSFEQNLRARHAANVRLPPWFSNLLPEGRLREWIALDREVSPQREAELLLQVGHDLSGAVRVIEDGGSPEDNFTTEPPPVSPVAQSSGRLRFSLAGVALKFSMLARGERLALPASGSGGDWIVKLPDRRYAHVPQNEFVMMSLARLAGVDVPATRLVHRDDIDDLDSSVWHETEEWAYAVQRFDRTPDRGAVHIEDLAQVRGFYPDAKYDGNYETIAALVHRGRDDESLREFVRRLVVITLISNGDAHLKNWSLIYPDRRVPHLAPAYDLVSTLPYMGENETLALKFAGTKSFEIVRPLTFKALERRLGTKLGLADVAVETAERIEAAWPEVEDTLLVDATLHKTISTSLKGRVQAFLSRR